jgi:hypothetical protein
VPDLPAGSPPPRRPTARSARRPRFVLPDDHHDERVGEHIEAFLEGPPVRARRHRRSRHLRAEGLRKSRRPVPLDTRADWDIALRHEDARVARYGRPAAVLAVRLRMASMDPADSYAARIGGAIRQQARETDRVTRVGPDRFHVLLPETVEAEATVLAERVRKACVALIPGVPGSELEIVVAAASTSSGGTLRDAVRTVQARTEG